MTIKRKSINKRLRLMVFDKCRGNCAYCGDMLKPRWCVDHVKPVERGGTNDIINLLPSCASCNNYKSVYDIEQLRFELGRMVERLFSYSTQFRIAHRFGLIELPFTPRIEFYFESIGIEVTP